MTEHDSMNRIAQVAIVVGVLSIFSPNGRAAVRYVKQSGTGTTCTSWSNACNLPTALGIADATTADQLWVQSGTYAPFALKNGVKIIGGFAGTETQASQSNPTVNLTIVDGGETARCVTNINSDPSAPAAVLRGFTLRKGRNAEGGGMYLNNSDARIVHCIFEGNSAGDFGGAVGIRGVGSPQFINCIFRKNGEGATNPISTMGGGAVFVHRGSPIFTNCLFHNNKAWEGGVIISMFGTPAFINCTMVNNHSTIGYGGALFDPDGLMSLRNCIVWGNTTASGVGSADQMSSGSGGTTLTSYSNIQGGWMGSNNLNADPLFVNPAGGDYHLQDASPCKNTGDSTPFANTLPPDSGDLDWNANTNEPTPKDLDLLARIRWLGPVDMGPYELPDEPPPGGNEN